MNSGCSESSCSGEHSVSSFSITSLHQRSRPGFIGASQSERGKTITCSSAWHSGRTSSSSDFAGITLPRRNDPSTVIRTLASDSCMRSATARVEKPPKTTLCTAPIRAHASIATGSSGTIGKKIPTTSPASTPSLLSAFANRQTSSRRSAYVIVLFVPSSPSHQYATLEPLPASTCRSRQLNVALILPPTNHFAQGGCQSRVRSHFLSQSSLPAQLSQNPSKSSSARE